MPISMIMLITYTRGCLTGFTGYQQNASPDPENAYRYAVRPTLIIFDYSCFLEITCNALCLNYEQRLR